MTSRSQVHLQFLTMTALRQLAAPADLRPDRSDDPPHD
jgi:hypothetical protein